MIPQISIDHVVTTNYYDEYALTEEDIQYLLDMSELNKAQDAIDEFINSYMIPPGMKFSDLSSRYLELSGQGLIDSDDRNKMLRTISILSVALGSLWLSNYTSFVKKVYTKPLFKEIDLTNRNVKNLVINDIVGQFEQLTNGAMSQTSSFVLNGIRSLQREMLTSDSLYRKLGLTGSELNTAIRSFKSDLKVRYPHLYKAMSDGNVLVSRKFVDGVEKVRHYKLDYYADMAIRAGLLNADRTATEIVAKANDEKVVEYVWIDTRPVKKDREICKDILGVKINGKSLLAFDKDIANILGIMTVDEARNTPDFAMSVGCRHGIRRLSKSFLGGIDSLIKNNTRKTA